MSLFPPRRQDPRRHGWILRFAALLVTLCSVTLLSETALSNETEQQEPGRRTLLPGDNLIGWVHFSTTPQDLFAQIPEAVLIYAWDAKQASYRIAARGFPSSLQRIEPGMGVGLRISGDERVEWTQPTVANGEWVSLNPGANLVAWTGPSGTPLDLAVRSIGDTFVQALYWMPEQQRLGVFDPAGSSSGEEMPTLNRGDALWVFNGTETDWLQPSGDRPLHRLGPPPDHLRWSAEFDKYLDADGLAIMATEHVADEALFRAAAIIDELLVNRPDIRDFLVRRREHIVVVGQFETSYDLAPYRHFRDRFERYGPDGPRGLGPSRSTPTLVPEEDLLCYDGDRYEGYDVSVHEFGHLIDFAISHSPGGQSFHSALVRSYEEAREAGWLEGWYAMTNTAEFWADGILYWFGLGRGTRSGISNRFELSHLLPSLADLVADTLGEFDLSATCQRAESKSHGASRNALVSMTLIDSDGEGAQPALLELLPQSGGISAELDPTWPGGVVHALVEPGGYRIRASIEGCPLYYNEAEPSVHKRDAQVISAGNENLSLQMQVPDHLCRYRTTGRVLNAQGDPAWGVIEAVRDDKLTATLTPKRDGTFSLRFPDAGRYELRLEYKRCRYVFDGSQLTNVFSRVKYLEAENQADNELVLRLPAGACEGQISGIVLDPRGEAATDATIGVQHSYGVLGPHVSYIRRVNPDGTFALMVDRPGEHVLRVSIPGCSLNVGENAISLWVADASPFKMTNENIENLEIRMPPEFCEP